MDDLPAVWQATNFVLSQAQRPEITLEEFRAEFCLPFTKFYKRYVPHIPLPFSLDTPGVASYRASAGEPIALLGDSEIATTQPLRRRRAAALAVLTGITLASAGALVGQPVLSAALGIAQPEVSRSNPLLSD